MSDFYGIPHDDLNGEFMRPSPYPFGDGGPGVTEDLIHQAGIADAIWRDQQLRAAEAATAASYAPDAQFPPAPSPVQPPAPRPLPPLTRAADRTPRKYPDSVRAYVPATPELTPAESESYTPLRSGSAALKIAGGVLAALTVSGIYVTTHQQEAPQKVPTTSEIVSPTQCDVSGIYEKDGRGTVQLRASVGKATVQVAAIDAAGMPALLQATQPEAGQPHVYAFNTNGLHNKTLVVYAGATVCAGRFDLGGARTGDETFLAG